MQRLAGASQGTAIPGALHFFDSKGIAQPEFGTSLAVSPAEKV
jgi:hypothetical protein